jgi:hypothetical protein
MTPFYADNNKTKILGTVNGKTFYWKIGSVVTCMNSHLKWHLEKGRRIHKKNTKQTFL